MKAFQIGAKVTLNSGTVGFIREIYLASEKGAQRDMGFYLFENQTNGTRFTVGHTEIKGAVSVEVSEAKEIAAAQVALDSHPDSSPFWDSPMGQETLELARRYGMSARNTDRERRAIHKKRMTAARREVYDDRK